MDIIAQTAFDLPKEFALAAIDGGGSKTECAVVNQDGVVLGVGMGGPSRLRYVELDESVQSISQAVSSALLDSTTEVSIVVCTHRITESEQLRKVIGDFFKCPIITSSESDAVFGSAGIFKKHGVAHVGGTGVVTWGFVAGEQKVMVGGWGMTAGDEGGGYDIAVHGLRAALRMLDGRGEYTVLLDRAKEHFGFSEDRESILAALPTITKRHVLASFAAIVASAAADGDPIALEIVNNAIQEQVSCIKAVARRVFERHEVFPLVLHGSVATSDMFAGGISKSVSAEFDNIRLFLPRYRPSVGLALFALNNVLEAAGRK